MRSFLLYLGTLSIILTTILPASAVNPDEVLSDPVLEQRARALSVDIRCLVCQNQSIDDSDAQLARDLRVLVREKLVEGLSDDQILDYLVERYGEFVLLKPRMNGSTLLLWIAPFVLLIVAGLVIVFISRRKPVAISENNALSESEEKKLSEMLDRSSD